MCCVVVLQVKVAIYLWPSRADLVVVLLALGCQMSSLGLVAFLFYFILFISITVHLGN